MDKYKILGRIANIYADGGNILEYLRDIEGHDHNSDRKSTRLNSSH